MKPNPELLQHESLTLRVERAPGATTVSWHGSTEGRDPAAFLGPALESLSTELQGRRVVVDFREFTAMSAATVGPIIQFLKALDAGDAETTVLYDRTVDWQRINFQLLNVMSTTLKQLRLEAV